MCSAIWFIGLIVQFARGSPQFEPLAAVGGLLWCTGNMFTVPTIQCIGLGLGLLIWGASNLMMGWASGAFGLYGTTKDEVSYPYLNYLGFAVSLISMCIFFFVKTSGKEDENKTVLNEKLLESDSQVDHNTNTSNGNGNDNDNSRSWVDLLSPLQKRVVGCLMAVGSGIFYGNNFNPPKYLQDNPDYGGRIHSSNSLDYVYSHFSGIFMTSTFYFIVYCAIKRNKPYVKAELVLPSFVSGLLWAVAQVSFFVANDQLQFVVSFPIISTGPGVIGSLWGILLFKEIKDRQAFRILFLAWFVTLVGVVLIALSKAL